MKKPEEIKKGLECCNRYDGCQSCPYDDEVEKGWGCCVQRNADALAYIRELEAELEQVKHERDAAIEDLKEVIEHGEGINFCTYCKHNEEDGQCVHPCNAYAGESGWEWRGIQEEVK